MTQRHVRSAAKSRPGNVVPNNLVPALTSFVGREADIHAIRGLVAGARLVSVTGPPGAGKTRVATEVADRLLAVFDGVWFVGLAPITNQIWCSRRSRMSSICGPPRIVHWSTVSVRN